MKKSIVLLITLFFIMAISVLVLKNLNETEEFLKNDNYITNNTQILLAVKNTQKEVSKLLVKYKNDVDEALENDIFETSIPINIEELQINFKIQNYARVNINQIKVKDSKIVEKIFVENDLYDYSLFEQVYKQKISGESQKVETSKQLDDIIYTFIKQYNNEKINEIKEYLGFFDQQNLYELYIDVSFFNSTAIAYYILNKDGKVQYFDINFK